LETTPALEIAAAIESIGHLGDARDRGSDGLGRSSFTVPVRHVRHVAAGCRAMSLSGTGIPGYDENLCRVLAVTDPTR
jgi:hypothetical protein